MFRSKSVVLDAITGNNEDKADNRVLPILYDRAYTNMEEMATRLCRFDYQVCNGGFEQWLANDYLDEDGLLLKEFIQEFVDNYIDDKYTGIKTVSKYDLGERNVEISEDDLNTLILIKGYIDRSLRIVQEARSSVGMCEECYGTGYIDEDCYCEGQDEECDTCNGTGKVEVYCEHCNGEGHFTFDDCLDRARLGKLDDGYYALDNDKVFEVMGKMVLLAL